MPCNYPKGYAKDKGMDYPKPKGYGMNNPKPHTNIAKRNLFGTGNPKKY